MLGLFKAPRTSPSNSLQVATPGAFFIQLDVYTEPTQYLVKVHARRTRLSLEIKHQQILVKVPSNCPTDLIESFLRKQQHWIKRAISKSSSVTQFHRNYQSGEPIWFKGEAFTLDIHTQCHGSAVIVNEQDKTISVFLSAKVKHTARQTRKLLRAFYLEQAQLIIPDLLSACEQKVGLHSSSLDFKFYQWRWGCCYQSGKVMFNPLLMAAPIEKIECVIIHELCHLKHMDHSRSFWALNRRFCDQCHKTKQWLKAHHQEVYLPPV
ncbi:M48 family metallopeptidase [Psychrosphaera ytuae]|uniref:M48 family metallopeptidase n=1 Tax=Psychrosphaera ytuae TaxID=2820710 RepID=UPI001E369DB7|nr:SprT family zinc-dependent metalloprotease [Psychrosphaera ytuae]